MTRGGDRHRGGYPLPYTTLTEFGKNSTVNKVEGDAVYNVHDPVRTAFVNKVCFRVGIWGFGIHVLSTSTNMRLQLH